ncbi:MAG: hypothetical protein IBJ11_02595 [Phycisphaerales bacterium]|nr:hypothetical protein [Phycisphaerales bacterium]
MVTLTEKDAEFRLFAPDARTVEILGSFTGWHDQPVAMRPHGDGWWSARLELLPGDHEFQYLIDRTVWLADYAAGGVRLSRLGSWVSLLTISPGVVPTTTVGSRQVA